MEKNSGVKVAFFIVILLVIIIGGYILMKKSISMNDNTTNNKKDNTIKVEQKNIKIDQTKDYVFFDNNDPVVSDLDIDYKKIYLNFKDNESIAQKLNNETDVLRKTVKIDDTLEDDEYDKLESAEYKRYEYFVSEDYISLVVKYYKFDRENLVTFNKCSTYTFTKDEGKYLTEEELLKKFNITSEEIENKITKFVSDQDILKEEEDLDSEATINNGYAVYVNKFGKLMASIIVKSSLKDYNEDINLS